MVAIEMHMRQCDSKLNTRNIVLETYLIPLASNDSGTGFALYRADAVPSPKLQTLLGDPHKILHSGKLTTVKISVT